MNRARARPAVVLTVLLGAGLVVLAGGRAWVTQAVTGVPGVTRVTTSGNQAVPAVTALALVAAAGAVAVALVGPIARRVVAVLLMLTGLGVAGLVVTVLRDPAGAVLPAVQNATGRVGSVPGGAAQLTAWPGLAVAGGLLIALAGGVAVFVVGRWQGSGRRFEVSGTGGSRPGIGAGADPDAAGVPGALGPSAARQARRERDLDAWDALSRGEDPTAG